MILGYVCVSSICIGVLCSIMMLSHFQMSEDMKVIPVYLSLCPGFSEASQMVVFHIELHDFNITEVSQIVETPASFFKK